VWVSVGLALAVIVLSVALLPQLFAVAHDEAYALTAGLNARVYNVLTSVLAAVTVSVAMRTVGLLLISALMVIPVATSQQFARGFRMTMAGAMVAGTVAALVGVGTSAFVDVPPGATIVLVALLGFVATWPVGLVVQRRRRARVPFPADPFPETGAPEHEVADEAHGHQHGPSCGHLAVEHGDHVDYIHHGHRHAAHGGHYDEH
jgi:zinc transport system permease protein